MPQINNYYLLDLPQVTQLASKCLKALMPQQYATLRNFHDDWQKPRKANDVLVSICALTEMENWLWYYDSLVPKAGQGMYLEVNFPDEKDVGKLINLLNKDFSSVTVIKETVVKHPDKIIIAKK